MVRLWDCAFLFFRKGIKRTWWKSQPRNLSDNHFYKLYTTNYYWYFRHWQSRDRVAHKPRPKRHHSWYQVVSRFHNFTTKKLNNCSLSIREFSDQLVFCVFPSELVCIAIMRCCSITNNGSIKSGRRVTSNSSSYSVGIHCSIQISNKVSDRIVAMAGEEHEVDDDDSWNRLRRFREKRKRDERPDVDDGM